MATIGVIRGRGLITPVWSSSQETVGALGTVRKAVGKFPMLPVNERSISIRKERGTIIFFVFLFRSSH